MALTNGSVRLSASIIIGLALTLLSSAAIAKPCPAGMVRETRSDGIKVCVPDKDATEGDSDSRDVAYMFDDDPLSGAGMNTNIVRITVVDRAVRRTLIRPRLNFIPELLKSVENI